MKLYCISTVIAALVLQGLMCKLAYIERGCAAVGGEMFVTPIVIFISYKLYKNRKEIRKNVLCFAERVKRLCGTTDKSKLV